MCVTEAAALTFFRCRGGGDVGGQTFTISSCSTDQVISIRSAEVGYDPQWNPSTNPPTCSWQSAVCTRSIANSGAIMRCNGQRSCEFSGSLFIYPQGSVPTLCPEQRDANFINIKYNCVTGT